MSEFMVNGLPLLNLAILGGIFYRLGRIGADIKTLNGRVEEAEDLVKHIRQGCPLCPKDNS